MLIELIEKVKSLNKFNTIGDLKENIAVTKNVLLPKITI